MRKTWVIAVREYSAAVRTKAFIIGLLIMPILMGGSILLQVLFKNVRDTEDKHFAILDQTGGQLFEQLEKQAEKYNSDSVDPDSDKQKYPRFVLEQVKPETYDAELLKELRLELSGRVRSGELMGFLEIGPDVVTVTPPLSQLVPSIGGRSSSDERTEVRYYTNRPTFQDFSQQSSLWITQYVLAHRAKPLNVTAERLLREAQPVPLVSKGLAQRNARTGEIEEASEQSKIAPVLVPVVLMMLMFMVVMMGATPLMQGVVEEKMLRIAEVLLGSVTPFQLMMGKLVGMVGVSLTIIAVYMSGAYWAANYWGFTEYLSPGLILWFLLFQCLSALMFGSLFIAVGAACTEMKETQNLLWPIMLLACLPLFVLSTVLKEPNGPVATGISFFPFATPAMMVAREAVPPGVPLWQLLVGIAIVLATTILCVYAAGRIFRVGILMQGKGARLRDIVRWVFHG